VNFERAGLVHAQIPITFGKHYWTVTIYHCLNINLNNEEVSGLMKLGVTSKSATSQKVHGPVINYSTSKGMIKVKFMLDYEHKTMRVFTASNLRGDFYTELPEGAGLFPAVQNMTMRSSNTHLRVKFEFDQVPFEFEGDQLKEFA